MIENSFNEVEFYYKTFFLIFLYLKVVRLFTNNLIKWRHLFSAILSLPLFLDTIADINRIPPKRIKSNWRHCIHLSLLEFWAAPFCRPLSHVTGSLLSCKKVDFAV